MKYTENDRYTFFKLSTYIFYRKVNRILLKRTLKHIRKYIYCNLTFHFC